jgi:hypothetical protein
MVGTMASAAFCGHRVAAAGRFGAPSIEPAAGNATAGELPRIA